MSAIHVLFLHRLCYDITNLSSCDYFFLQKKDSEMSSGGDCGLSVMRVPLNWWPQCLNELTFLWSRMYRTGSLIINAVAVSHWILLFFVLSLALPSRKCFWKCRSETRRLLFFRLLDLQSNVCAPCSRRPKLHPGSPQHHLREHQIYFSQ